MAWQGCQATAVGWKGTIGLGMPLCPVLRHGEGLGAEWGWLCCGTAQLQWQGGLGTDPHVLGCPRGWRARGGGQAGKGPPPCTFHRLFQRPNLAHDLLPCLDPAERSVWI